MVAFSQSSPAVKELVSPASPGGLSQHRQDINLATVKELGKIPGMTRESAERIGQNRPYRKLDELVSRKIIGRKQFALIKEFISVGGLRGP